MTSADFFAHPVIKGHDFTKSLEMRSGEAQLYCSYSSIKYQIVTEFESICKIHKVEEI